ncbi:Xaa-Pro dipeptidyl-peptidase [Oenococcus sicerae]|uniref:Xaa-Pro dipeptidyl-peptidase n=1 Tax=Oenococcus sicerae TaxID=2203724 RepID=UPI0039E8D48F
MKNNFSYEAFTDNTVFDSTTELKKIALIDDSFAQKSFSDKLRIFFNKLFPNCDDAASIEEAQRNILITDRLDLVDFMKQDLISMPSTAFYTIIAQLLDFNSDLDFQLDEGRQFLLQTGQQILEEKLVTTDNVDRFMFNALILRSANGLSFIDNLVNDGLLKKNFRQQIPQPLFFAGKALAVFKNADLVNENVYIDTLLDTDHDGHNDLVLLTVTRPKKASALFKLPVILTASPYYYGTNDMAADVHSPKQDLAIKADYAFQTSADLDTSSVLPALSSGEKLDHGQFKKTTASGASSFPLNDYFLARGYAVAYYAGLGTRGSDGLRSSGGEDETIACCAAIEYLSGHRFAFISKKADASIMADWSNGSVAMTGRSYLGTLATACATRNPLGLKTIIAESAISSWYDYYRENGLVVAPGGFQGEDADVLALDTFSRWFDAAQMQRIKLAFQQSLTQMKQDEDRQTGNYNVFWDKRNYLKAASKIKIDCLYVHGLNDWNVKPIHVFNILSALSQNHNIAVKTILHQGQHISPHDIRSLDYLDICNMWLTHELFGLENEVTQKLPAIMVQDNLDPKSWHSQTSWTKTDQRQSFNLSDLTGQTELSYRDNLSQLYETKYADYATYENDFYGADQQFDRAVCKIDLPDFRESTINGRVQIDLRLKTDRKVGLLTAALIELNPPTHTSSVTKSVLNRNFQINLDDRAIPLRDFYEVKEKYHLISNGHINLQNRQGADLADQVDANTYLDLKLLLQPTIYRITRTSKLVLFIFGGDMQYTLHPKTIQEYTIDLTKSRIILPFL